MGTKKSGASTDDGIWKALSDPTRRQILDLLRDRPHVTGDLCDHFEGLSRCAVMKHLGILEAAALVLVRREGRFRWNHLNPVPIQQIHERWIRPHVETLATAAVRLKEHVETRKGRKRP